MRSLLDDLSARKNFVSPSFRPATMSSDAARSPTRDEPGGDSTPPPTLSESDLRNLAERSALAREAACAAMARYSQLLAKTEQQLQRSQATHEATRAARDEIRLAVDKYAIALKALGTPPERALRLVKEAVRDNVSHDEREDSGAVPIMEAVARWCIESYYGNQPAA